MRAQWRSCSRKRDAGSPFVVAGSVTALACKKRGAMPDGGKVRSGIAGYGDAPASCQDGDTAPAQVDALLDRLGFWKRHGLRRRADAAGPRRAAGVTMV